MSEWKTASPKSDALGRLVRQVWLDFCAETKLPPSHNHDAPWEELSLWEKEVDRRIGEAVYAKALADAEALCRARAQKHSPRGLRLGAAAHILVALEREAIDCADAIAALKETEK